MYKELIISILIFLAIIALDMQTQNYTNNSVNEISDSLNQLKEEIRNEEADANKLSDNINNIYDKWQVYHDKLVLYIEHDEIEQVESHFVATKSLIESNQYDVALADLEQTIFVLNHISKKYKLTLENIF